MDFESLYLKFKSLISSIEEELSSIDNSKYVGTNKQKIDVALLYLSSIDDLLVAIPRVKKIGKYLLREIASGRTSPSQSREKYQIQDLMSTLDEYYESVKLLHSSLIRRCVVWQYNSNEDS